VFGKGIPDVYGDSAQLGGPGVRGGGGRGVGQIVAVDGDERVLDYDRRTGRRTGRGNDTVYCY
jgi:hypothetical protein